MPVILMTTLFYKALILQGEIWYWSLLGLKVLMVLLHRTIGNDYFWRNTTFQHCSNIATLCSAKNRPCKWFPVTSPKSEEEEEK